MRLISQDKNLDFPYEMVSVECIDTSISICGINYGKDRLRRLYVGNYSSHERCLQIMENIQRKYQCGSKIFEFPEE